MPLVFYIILLLYTIWPDFANTLELRENFQIAPNLIEIIAKNTNNEVFEVKISESDLANPASFNVKIKPLADMLPNITKLLFLDNIELFPTNKFNYLVSFINNLPSNINCCTSSTITLAILLQKNIISLEKTSQLTSPLSRYSQIKVNPISKTANILPPQITSSGWVFFELPFSSFIYIDDLNLTNLKNEGFMITALNVDGAVTILENKQGSIYFLVSYEAINLIKIPNFPSFNFYNAFLNAN